MDNIFKSIFYTLDSNDYSTRSRGENVAHHFLSNMSKVIVLSFTGNRGFEAKTSNNNVLLLDRQCHVLLYST